MTAANQTLTALLENLRSAEFWGTLTIKFQHGQAVHITKEESIPTVPNNRRSYEKHSN
jgi:hypothetical protein